MYLEKCSESQRKEIYAELNITEESLKRDVNYLMEWIEKQPHLPNAKADEEFMSHLLIHCKNSLEKVKKFIDFYYCTRAMFPMIYTNYDPTSDAYRRAFNVGCAVPLPKLTPEGYRVFFYKVFDHENSHLMTPEDYIKMIFMNMAIDTKDDLNRKLVFIYDFQNISVNLATTMFTGTRKYVIAVQGHYTFRIHQIHLIAHLNPTFSMFFNITKSLLKKKLADRILLWNNERPDLTSIFPAEILPADYGGKEKPLKELHEMYYQYVCGFRDWFKLEENMVADLSKRTDDLYKNSMDESVDGSFRQLIID